MSSSARKALRQVVGFDFLALQMLVEPVEDVLQPLDAVEHPIVEHVPPIDAAIAFWRGA
jgi:hypothetical protein